MQRWVTMIWNVSECQETVLTNLRTYVRLLFRANRYSANQFWCLWHISRQPTFGITFSPCWWIFLSLFWLYFCAKGWKLPQILEHRPSCWLWVLCHMEQDCSWSRGGEGGGGGLRGVNNIWCDSIFCERQAIFCNTPSFFLLFFSLFKFTLMFYSVSTTQVLASEYSFIDSILTFAAYILNYWKWRMIIAVNKRRSLKKIRASTGFEPVTSAIPVRCSTNWAMKPHIGSEVNLLSSYLPVQWSDVKFIWNNSYLYCGCRWKWRMIIAVNFPI